MTRAIALASATLQIKVVPRTAHNRIDGWQGETLKVRLQAPRTKTGFQPAGKAQ